MEATNELALKLLASTLGPTSLLYLAVQDLTQSGAICLLEKLSHSYTITITLHQTPRAVVFFTVLGTVVCEE